MIKERLGQILSELPSSVSLIAVSKYHSEDEIMEAYEIGQRCFGENLVQEMQRKHQNLPLDIEWHFIGHLQRNKVKYIAPYVTMIHSVDSPELLLEINRQAQKVGRQIPCLLQIHIAKEETKFGFTPQFLRDYLAQGEWCNLAGVCIRGIMCMASHVADENQISQEFHQAMQLFQEIKDTWFSQSSEFSCRSWGMSDDYHLAINQGSNMVRIGSSIFGERDYSNRLSKS